MIEHKDRSPPSRRAAMVLVPTAVCVALVLGFAPRAHPQSQPKVKIAFVGNSTADGLWGGMTSLGVHNTCIKTSFELGRFAKNSTGLTRPGPFRLGARGAADRRKLQAPALHGVARPQ